MVTINVKRYFKRLGAAVRNKSLISDSLDSWHDLARFLGIDVDGTPKDALSNVTYYSCLKTLSESVGKLPLKVMQHTDSGGVEERRNNKYWTMLHDRPNKFMTATGFWSLMEYNRNHYGNGYAWLIDGKDPELYPLEPWSVEIWYDNARILGETETLWYRYTGTNGQLYMIPHDSILHVRNFSSQNGIAGKPVRDVLAETIQGNIKAQKMLNKLYDNGFSNKAVVQYTDELSDENRKKFLKGIQKFINGEYKEDGIDNLIPIPYGVKLEPMSNTKLADSQFLELKQYSAIQIASAFGIKPVQIGDLTKASYASAEAQQLSFLIDTLLYIIKQYEEEINYKVLDGTDCYAKFNVDVILRADFRNKVETLATAVNSFMMTPDEARRKLDLGNKPGGDQLVGNGSTIPLAQVGAQYSSEKSADTKVMLGVLEAVLKVLQQEEVRKNE